MTKTSTAEKGASLSEARKLKPGEYDLSGIIRDRRGKALPDPSDPDSEFSVAMAVANALDANLPNDQNADGITKARRFHIASLIHDSAPEYVLALKSDYISTIKDAVGRAYSPLVVGQIYAVVDPAEKF